MRKTKSRGAGHSGTGRFGFVFSSPVTNSQAAAEPNGLALFFRARPPFSPSIQPRPSGRGLHLWKGLWHQSAGFVFSNPVQPKASGCGAQRFGFVFSGPATIQPVHSAPPVRAGTTFYGRYYRTRALALFFQIRFNQRPAAAEPNGLALFFRARPPFSPSIQPRPSGRGLHLWKVLSHQNAGFSEHSHFRQPRAPLDDQLPWE
jgi:hypothetical protein